MARLRVYMPEHLLEKIRAQDRIEGERRPVTVLFADLAGFTSLAEKLDPEEVTTLTNECLEAMVRAVFKYEGFVDKLIGDAVMALFGAPVAHEDDPERALRCALEMREAMEAIAIVLPGQAQRVNLHMGIHSGEVVVGEVGSDLRLAYTALGDTVNLAARLQELAEPGKILVSEAAHRLTEPLFDFEALKPQAMKGKEEPVVAFRLLKVRALARPLRGVPGLQSPLIGREEEFNTLAQSLKAVRQKRGQIVGIIGEPGVGKSRLVVEARSQNSEGLRWLEGRCLSYGGSIAFWPLLEILREWATIHEEDTETAATSKLRLYVRRLFLDRVEEVLPYLATLLSLRLEGRLEERVKYLSADELQSRIFLAVREWLEALAQQQPTILVFEDLHWADPSSVSLLEHLMASTDKVPLMLLMVARAERDQPWWSARVKAEREYPHRYTEIALLPLSAEESDQLVSNLLAIPDFPESVHKLILEKAEGNPFFVEEVIRGLIDSRVLVRQNGRWRVTARIFDLEIPDTVQGVILARIDRLEGQARQVLQRAAIIGRSFLYRILAQIAEAEAELERHLATLQRVELIRERTRLPELEYIFKHALTQEVAYGTLLQERRKDLHQKVGQAIEYLFPDRLEEFYGLLAHHYTEAEDADKALPYLIKAGERARSVYANGEALVYFDRGLVAAQARGDVHLQRQLSEALGDIYGFTGPFVQAVQNYENALGQADDPETKARLLRKIGDRYRDTDHDLALSYYQQAVRELDEESPSAELANIWVGIGRVHHYRAEYSRALEYYTKAEALFKEAGRHRDLVDCYNMLAGTYQHLANYPESMDCARKAIELSQKIDFPWGEAVGYEFLAEDGSFQGSWDDGIYFAQSDRDLGEKIGALPRVAWADFILGMCSRAKGDLTQAGHYLDECRELAAHIGEERVYIFASAALAGVYFDQGRLEEATSLGHEALQRADAVGEVVLRTMTRGALGELHLRIGHAEEAIRLLEESLDIASGTEIKDAPLIARAVLGEAYLRAGRTHEADRIL